MQFTLRHCRDILFLKRTCILDSVPITMKHKEQFLLFILKDNPNMTWDDDGTVKLYGKAIQGSNIIDLVNDVVRHRKGSEPTGWQPFAEGLSEMNIPQDVIENKDRWDWMHRDVSSPRTPDDSIVTQAQKHVSTARKRASRIPISGRKTTKKKRRIITCYCIIAHKKPNSKTT